MERTGLRPKENNMSEEPKEEVKPVEVVDPLGDKPKVPAIKLQYVFITLADGRRGAFAGPELISKAELLLKPPVLVDLVFSEPKERGELDAKETKIS
jgi:hypothetical protein